VRLMIAEIVEVMQEVSCDVSVEARRDGKSDLVAFHRRRAGY
jgi:hypothetical protein